MCVCWRIHRQDHWSNADSGTYIEAHDNSFPRFGRRVRACCLHQHADENDGNPDEERGAGTPYDLRVGSAEIQLV